MLELGVYQSLANGLLEKEVLMHCFVCDGDSSHLNGSLQCGVKISWCSNGDLMELLECLRWW